LTKLKILTAKELERVLFALGFEIVRQKGSHVFYRHPDGRVTTIPHHKGVMLARPLIRAILRDIRLSVDEFNNLLS
jgi:predicted RNA binding protein YcfA (HicA-like mRNA interferase family)